jgi:HTH-type transcriptional regulator, global nitrogen regulator NrpRI
LPIADMNRTPPQSSSPEDVERKTILILRILSESDGPVGARIVAARMRDHGVTLSERSVRYHLKLMDERGLTLLAGRRDGRAITDLGREELAHARVRDKIGFVISRIETLAYKTSFNPGKGEGMLPVNVSLFSEEIFGEALEAMVPAFQSELYVSDRVAMGRSGERLGDIVVPEGKTGLATVCSIVINGYLLKNGIPMDSKFGGILQVRRRVPLRFVELIYYAGSSLDPSEAFIRGKMTSVGQAIRDGEGKILANFREVPAPSVPLVKRLLGELQNAGIGGVMTIGDIGEPICQVPVDPSRVGLILMGGLNPVACAQEAGLETENRAMSTVMDFKALQPFATLRNLFR